MAYQTYTTEAVVCGVYPSREHDVTLRLFTRDAGMIYARAGGARAGQSKLRYGLQDFSYARVTLVRGHADWRVTGAVALGNFYFESEGRTARHCVRQAARSLRRLVQGDGVHPELFSIVLDGIQTLAKGESSITERLFTLRLLHHLGYVSPHPDFTHLLHAETLDEAYGLFKERGEPAVLIEATIENALTASHL